MRSAVHRNVAPAEEALAQFADHALEVLLLPRARIGILRKEDHARCVGAERRQLDPELLRLAAQEAIGELEQDAGAVAGFRVAAAGAAMFHALEHLDALVHQRVRLRAVDLRDEADAARVVLVRRVVETLRGGTSLRSLHAHSFSRGAHSDSSRCGRGGRRRRGNGASVGSSATRVRSEWVDNTTIVSLRVTPSMRRIRSIKRSRVSVLSVRTFSINVCWPVT